MAPDASTSPVDWSRPIEAVHPKFGVFPATYCPQYTEDGRHFIRWRIDGSGWSGAFYDSGASTMGQDWSVRNVQLTTPERDPALWDRMEAHFRAVVKRYEGVKSGKNAELDEARAIVADLPKPVDPDLIEAREVCFRESLSEIREDSSYLKGGLDNSLSMRCALAAIKRGRELAGEQA